MAGSKYCRECHAKVMADQTVCPFCGGELSEDIPEELPGEDTVLLREGATRKEHWDLCVAIVDKMAIRTWGYLLMFSVAFTALTLGTGILDPVCIAMLGVMLGLSVAVYLTKSDYLSYGMTALSLALVIYTLIAHGSAGGLLAVVVAAYTSFKLFRYCRDWREYLKTGKAVTVTEGREQKVRYRDNSSGKNFLVILVFVLAFAGAFAWNYSFNHRENQKYQGFTVGEWQDGKYTNQFADVNFTLPEGWRIVEGDELAGKNADTFGNSKPEEACYCTWIENGHGEYVYLELYRQNTEKYVPEDVVVANRENRQKKYENDGTPYEFSDDYTVQFCGREFSGVTSKATFDGKDEYIAMLVDSYYKYTIMAVFSADTPEDAQDIENHFGFDAQDFGLEKEVG